MLEPYNFVILVAFVVLMLGIGTFIVGVVILVRTAHDEDIKTMSLQTTRLVNKGIAEDVAGLVGNASNLLDSMNKLAGDRRGVGLLLTVIGMVLMAAAFTMAFLIYRVNI